MFAHQVIDDISKQYYHHDEGYQKEIWLLLPAIKKSQCFHIEDIDSTLNSVKHDKKGMLFIDNAPFLKLPYKVCWFDSVLHDENFSKFGCLIFYVAEHILSTILFVFLKPHKKWMLLPIEYIFNTEKDFTASQLKKIFPCTEPPRMLSSSGGFTKMLIKALVPMANEEINSFANLGRKYLTAVENMILLLNCKNIETEKIIAPESLNKKRRKAGKQELFDYHVLNVVVPSKKSDYREATTPLSHNRVHLCRGHFKEYTAEHPLFGHYTGLFWWQPHVRGQNKDGIVMKDYNVRPN